MSQTSEAHTSDEQSWRQLLAPYKKSSWSAALFQLANTAIPFAVLWYLMYRALDHSYLLTLLLAVPMAGLFTRLFIFQHDCGHGSFLPSRRGNHLLGALLGVVTFFPYDYWRRTHAMHHATNGNLDERELGDINTFTVREYLAMSPLRRLAYRLYRNPLVLFGLGPTYQFLLKHRFPFDAPWTWKREWKSVLYTNVGILALWGGIGWVIGWKALLLVELPIVLLAGGFGVWLFYVQHQFEDTYWDRQDAWDFYRAGVHGSSFYDLPPVLHWFTGNIGYHHIHHLASGIPNYRLAACYRENPAMQRVTKLTFMKSLRCARLRLWDEERRAMIGFRELRADLRAAAAAPAVPPVVTPIAPYDLA
jgi:acyl-lipid omega-6 desaturase (Delta-12 desaturase)